MKRERGFTLVEVLVSLVLLGFIVTLWMQENKMVRSAEAATVRESRHVSGLTDQMRVSRMLRSAFPSSATGDTPSFVGDAANLDIAAVYLHTVPETPGGVTSLDSGRLVLRTNPGGGLLMELSPLGSESPTPVRYTLFSGAGTAAFSYLDHTGTWRHQWPDGETAELPAAVKIRFETHEIIIPLPCSRPRGR